MTPLRFGPGARQLFAVHHPAEGERRRQCVLLCNPFGQEAIRSHRLFRLLAEQLTRHGFDVMRFDYFGTGDAGGEDGEGELEGWCRDVLAADAELRRRSACERVSWVGLRLGASIAALASQSGARAVEQILLWDPVVDGTAYLAALLDAHVAACRDSFGARWAIDARLRDMALGEAQTEALGFALPALLRRQLERLSARGLAQTRADRISLLAAPGSAALADLQQRLGALGNTPALRSLQTHTNWLANETMGASIAPGEIVTSVVALLEAA
ncbi:MULTISPECIES: serine aminopeptidase domain-containing protein [unclassified Janthinobacterium]|uniref:serine aminopeptidase domain-containing protein n=1 Tax=unclassified Janthinobacterium TaxID=2610881 RepID=UPI000346A392|nr:MULTISPECIES: alpha/beta hydrolase [unclassified Janthinobacterium]MEC5161201.1 alpha/beta superfamily hydrolase [Janthinobacterium sp. CG_S6]